MTDIRARQLHRDRAQRAFTRAAAALTEIADPKTLAFAFLEGAIGLLEIAKADETGEALELMQKRLEAAKVNADPVSVNTGARP